MLRTESRAGGCGPQCQYPMGPAQILSNRFTSFLVTTILSFMLTYLSLIKQVMWVNLDPKHKRSEIEFGYLFSHSIRINICCSTKSIHRQIISSYYLWPKFFFIEGSNYSYHQPSSFMRRGPFKKELY